MSRFTGIVASRESLLLCRYQISVQLYLFYFLAHNVMGPQ